MPPETRTKLDKDSKRFDVFCGPDADSPWTFVGKTFDESAAAGIVAYHRARTQRQPAKAVQDA